MCNERGSQMCNEIKRLRENDWRRSPSTPVTVRCRAIRGAVLDLKRSCFSLLAGARVIQLRPTHVQLSLMKLNQFLNLLNSVAIKVVLQFWGIKS